MSQGEQAARDEKLEFFKECLSEPRLRIKLDDLVNAAVRAALLAMGGERFPLDAGCESGADFAARLEAYEECIRPLQAQAVLLGRWATPEQRTTMTNMLARACDICADTSAGNGVWLGLRWYPVSLLMYAAGIAALSAENYPAFAAIHTKRVAVRTRRFGKASVGILLPVIEGMSQVAETNAWNCIEGYKRLRTPDSDHIFGVLRPLLDELIFLGAGYDSLFDRYEILRSLLYADMTDRDWAPVGRFAWKCGGGDDAFAELRAEAKQQQDAWGPLQAGLFRGSHSRFEETASKFEAGLLSKIGWH